MLYLLLVPVLAAAGLLSSWLVKLPDVAYLAASNPNTTVLIEARQAEAAAKGRPFTLSWNWVPLEFISPHLQRAVIVSEDASFYQHNGFDWEGLQEALTHDWEQGKLRRGGSTITQQLAKNLYLSSEKTLLRKAREALIAWEIERRLPKKRILELYLNVAEWGQGIFGAEAASRRFPRPSDCWHSADAVGGCSGRRSPNASHGNGPAGGRSRGRPPRVSDGAPGGPARIRRAAPSLTRLSSAPQLQ